jgi:hypothetical protein
MFYKSFLSGKNIQHSEKSCKYIDGINILTNLQKESNVDGVTYLHYDKFFLYGALHENKDETFYYDYLISGGLPDVISDISVKYSKGISISYICATGELSTDELKEYIFACSMYSPFSIRLTFSEKPNPEDFIEIFSKMWLFSAENRIILINSPKVYNRGIVYEFGNVYKKY